MKNYERHFTALKKEQRAFFYLSFNSSNVDFKDTFN